MTKRSDSQGEAWVEMELRAAAAELDTQIPDGYFENFSSRLAATLEGVTMEPTGSSNLSSDLSNENSGPAIMAGNDQADRDEHSGLHEIKALASSARERITRRRTTEHDLEESLLAGSSSGLPAVVLPDPEKSTPQMEVMAASSPALDVVNLEHASASASFGSASASASFGAGVAQPSAPKPWLWIAMGGVALAAAVLAFVLLRAPSGAHDEPPTVAANSETAESQAPSDPAPAAAPSIAPLEDADESEADSDLAPEPELDGASEGELAAAAAKADDSREAKALEAKSRARIVTGVVGGSASDRSDRSKKEKDVAAEKAAKKLKKENDAKIAKEAAKGAEDKYVKGPTDGKEDIDSILDEVTGGPSKAKVETEEEKKPDLKKIGSSQVRKAMGGVSGKVNRCGTKTGFTGKVKAKFSVAPSGKVTKAKATVSDAKVKRCVEAAVRSARFPTFEPPAASFSYLFLISD